MLELTTQAVTSDLRRAAIDFNLDGAWMSKIFSQIQDHQDALQDRFCSPKRRVVAKTKWFPDSVPFERIEDECLKDILFYESRGYYLFQEPALEHQPVKRRFRVVLTYKPTESNG